MKRLIFTALRTKTVCKVHTVCMQVDSIMLLFINRFKLDGSGLICILFTCVHAIPCAMVKGLYTNWIQFTQNEYIHPSVLVQGMGSQFVPTI